MSPRIVVRSGSPTEEELAVVATVLLGRAAAAAAAADGADGRPRTPAWARAGRLEALGHPPLGSSVDLRLLPRG